MTHLHDIAIGLDHHASIETPTIDGRDLTDYSKPFRPSNLDRAWLDGYRSGRNGHTAEPDGILSDREYDAWMGGWNAGYADFRAAIRSILMSAANDRIGQDRWNAVDDLAEIERRKIADSWEFPAEIGGAR